MEFDESFYKKIPYTTLAIKWSQLASFLVASANNRAVGFLAFYQNDEERYAYITEIVVHKGFRRKYIGHCLLEELRDICIDKYNVIRLEVFKSNLNALHFYHREGFVYNEDRGEKLLLEYSLENNY